MCGILGGNNPNWDYEKGIEAMKHRGPDNKQINRTLEFTLAFTRLSIIDLSENAMQPMFTKNGQVGLVFNGEIYGYKKLRMKLEKLGYDFISSADTEVLLNAYLEWGNDFIDKIDGMFGIAIYDKRINKIKLFRDRVGIKPLYYYCKDKHFGFASELKGIIQMCSNTHFIVDKTAVYDYMNCLYIPDPKTLYKDVYKLEPSHYLIYDLTKSKIEKKGIYWKLKINEQKSRQKKIYDIQDELKYLIRSSVASQMVADVPVGTFLSGGVDSSIITYEAKKINQCIKAFTIGFSENKFDESKFAAKLAHKIDVENVQKFFKKEDFLELYSNLFLWFDEPFADTSAFPTFLLCNLAKNNVTVALSGDGADEIFGGYPRYQKMRSEWNKKILNISIISNNYKNLFNTHTYSKLEDFFCEELQLLLYTFQNSIRPDFKKVRKELGIPKDYDDCWFLRQHNIKDLPPITRSQYIDFKTYLPGDILAKIDRTSMAVSLETRVPFLNKDIIEFSFALSEEDRCPGGELKGLLKQTYEKEIGKDILCRSKKGFSIPVRYLRAKNSPQEEILHKIWKSRLNGFIS